MQRNSSTKMWRNCVMAVPSGEGFFISSGLHFCHKCLRDPMNIPMLYSTLSQGSWAVVHTATGRATECHRAILNYLTISNLGFKKNNRGSFVSAISLCCQQFSCTISALHQRAELFDLFWQSQSLSD